MSTKRWEELLVYKLRGERFDEHVGVELLDLEGLLHLRAALVEIAKAEWKHRFDRQRIPNSVEEQIDIRVRGFEEGCVEAQILLGRPVKSTVQKEQIVLFDVADESAAEGETFFDSLHRAAELLAGLGGHPRKEDLPDWFPLPALQSWSKMAARISEGEHLSLIVTPRSEAVVLDVTGEPEEPPEVIESALDLDGELVHEEIYFPYDVAAREAIRQRPSDIAGDSGALLRDLHKTLVEAKAPAMVPTPVVVPDVRTRTFSGEVRMVDLDRTVRLHLHPSDERGIELRTRPEDDLEPGRDEVLRYSERRLGSLGFGLHAEDRDPLRHGREAVDVRVGLEAAPGHRGGGYQAAVGVRATGVTEFARYDH